MKQNKNSSVIRFFSFMLAVVALVLSISVPSFATIINDIGFDTQPLPVGQSFLVGTDTNGYSLNVTASTDSVYMYARDYGTSHPIYFVSFEPFTVSWHSVLPGSYDKTGTFTGALTTYPGTNSAYTGRTYYYITGTMDGSGRPFNSNGTAYIPLVQALYPIDDWLSYMDNLPVVPAAHSFSGTLPAGNAIILDVSGNSSEPLSLSTSSALRHKDNWSDGNQMMGYFSTAPTSLSSPFDGTHSITWRGTGSPNLFGGYNTWNSSAPLLPTGNYLVIVNPAYPNDNPDSITSNQASNGAISITCGFVRSATIVPLSSSWDNGSIVSSSGNIRLDGEYDPDTDSWSFVNSSTGEPQNPVSGGLTDVDAEHITINDWLQNISHQIGSFFSGAIGAVSTLVSAGSDFIHSLSGLYAWLPAPVYSVLVSALILVITIGVIKVFI